MADEVAREWGRNIREQRVARGWSQRELANRVGVTPQSVSKWEKGLSAPSRTHQSRIAGAFELSGRLLFPISQAA